MPLVRFEVRNEYGLGAPELYRVVNKDDSKAVFDGVAVAGMVGILRQLGDLAELAAEVFQGLQEQVMATAARSHNMMARVQHMEAALPPLEKAVLTQKCHIHFAYTAGFDWHANIQTKQNHLVHGDVPRFIMDSYEECRGPPRLELLDKFDTSGPGACLKRYSDPSIFKTTLASTDPVNIEKGQGERKAEKGKKKGAQFRNLDVPHVVLISYRGRSSSKIQFAPNSFGKKFSMETISALSMRPGSELGNRSTSFDSRTTSDNAEHNFDASSSIQNKELEHNGSLNSRLKMQYCEANGSTLHHEPIGGSHDIYSERSLHEESINNSSSVDWVEKTEIVKPTNQGSENFVGGQHEASESNTVHSDPDKLENETTGVLNVGPDDSLGNHQNVNESLSDKKQFDESGNKPYSGTIAEVETHFNQAKEEANLQSANLRNNGSEYEKGVANMTSAQNSAPSSIEPSSSSKHPIQNFIAKSVPLDDFHGQSPKSQELFVDTDIHGSTDFLDISRGEDLESAISDIASSVCRVPSSPASLSDQIITSPNDSHESAYKISAMTSSKFWTNGGLLGLEPSKPLDGLVSDSVDEQIHPSGTSMPKSHSDESMGKVDLLLNSSESNPGFEKGRERSTERISPNNPLPEQTRRMGDMVSLASHSECSIVHHDKQDNSKDSCPTCQFSDTQGCGPANSGIRNPRTELTVIPEVGKPTFVGDSTGMLGLNSELDANSSQSKVPISMGEPSNSVKTDPKTLQDSHCIQHNVPNRNLHQPSSKLNHSGNLKHESSTNFLSSSPPIQHMKISFNSVGRVETSKLKLKVSDGLHFSDITKDFIFPSFQLLPEPAIQLSDIDYESDDGTFCGSSQYMSDELMSQFSESSAEQWESAEIPGNEGSMVYDALCRVSSVQSISSSLEHEGIANDSIYADSDYKSLETDNGIHTFHSGCALDLLSFDAVSSLKGQKDKKSLISQNNLDLAMQHLNQPMPPPPPLPPLQWCVRKTQTDEDKQGVKSEAFNGSKHLHVPVSITSKLDPPVQPQMESAAFPTKNEQDQKKFKVWREANHVINGKDMDENEDLLHQIKIKSLNLRRTVPARPTQKANPTADIKVTAILEKANAIRQAFVGSDEEEDDN